MRYARKELLMWAVTIGAVGSGPAVQAVDRWEVGHGISSAAGDDFPSTPNELRHGTTQTGHDFDSDTDEDWSLVRVRNRRSYEARVWSGTAPWFAPGAPNCLPTCARFARVDVGGTVLTDGVADGTVGIAPGRPGASHSVRWLATADGQEYVRATSGAGFSAVNTLTYDLVFYDTTYLLPRFNNSGTQTTVLIIQNGKADPVTGQVDFYSATGTHLHSQPLALAANAAEVLNTSTIPALQGMSGSATVAHTAGYGGLAGKGVALEPATGFTFDTVLSPLPY